MNPIITAILALITAAPATIAQVQALWNEIRTGLSAQDQAVPKAPYARSIPPRNRPGVFFVPASTQNGARVFGG